MARVADVEDPEPGGDEGAGDDPGIDRPGDGAVVGRVTKEVLGTGVFRLNTGSRLG